jgi:hypothetical protein
LPKILLNNRQEYFTSIKINPVKVLGGKMNKTLVSLKYRIDMLCMKVTLALSKN